MDEFEMFLVNEIETDDVLDIDDDSYLLDETVNMYDYYISDIYSLNKKSVKDKNKLLREVILIVGELNKLLDLVISDIQMDDGRNVPWISDKVNYCIKNCNNTELLNDIRRLYDQYISKRNVLLELYLKFVIMIANSFYKSDERVSMDDLIQYGNIGLIRAIEMYDINKGVEFSTYAYYWIKQSIINNSKRTMNLIKMPIYFYEIRNRWSRIFEELINKYGRFPTKEEIALCMSEDMEKVDMILNLFNNFVSLDELVEDRLDDLSDVSRNGVILSRINFIADDLIDLDRNIIYDEMSRELEYYMDLCLNEREKFILKARYGFIDEMSALKLAEMYNVSEQRIYQIIQGAFRKLYKNKEFRKMRVYLR